jgi:8-oxo-dGTP pyrophosphatase MutT (NUDIX family)
VQLPVAVRRLGFRIAYRALRVYWFVLRPTLRGVKCVLTDGDRVLLVRHTYGPPRWEIPGGAIKRGEPPSRAAQRELHEELGIDVPELTPLGPIPVTIHNRAGELHCFGAPIAAPRIELDQAELAEARWFCTCELPANLGPYVRPIVALARGATG